MKEFIFTLWGTSLVALWIIFVLFIVKKFKEKTLNYLEYITAITIWLLLAIVFLWFIPELTEHGFVGWNLWIAIMVWLLVFYLLELFLHWHHCRDLENTSCGNHKHNHDKHKSWILMFGSTILHNAFHGIVLFSAFSYSVSFWVATTIAVLLHSIPQNVVNYIMNHNNPKYAYFAAIWTVLWALILFPFTKEILSLKPYILALITWWLLYTALADIFPEFKERWTTKQKLIYLMFIFFGILLFVFFEHLAVVG